MQRRLAIALVLTALVSVLLVGFGILAIAQLGAQSRAEDRVERGLNVLVSLLQSESGRRQPPSFGAQSRRDLGLDLLEAARIAPDGSVTGIGRGARGGGATLADLPAVELSSEDWARLDAGDAVLRSADGTVVGIRLLAPRAAADEAGGRFVLVAAERVSAVPRETVTWFVLSSAVVLAGALAAGILLARRLANPIRDIQGATAAIAAGQLGTRIEVTGDDEVAELGRSVNRMASDLARSKALDQQFLLSVSHDLRTPLTAISGYAEALRDGAASPEAAGEVIGNHASRLDRLVGDLLDLAKLDANRFRLDLRRVDLAVVAGRTAAGLAPDAAQRGIALDQGATGHHPVISADADRLAQAVGNVIVNALAFADQRVLVTVDEIVDAEGRAWGRVIVDDDGPGFHPDDLPFVFDRLYTGRAQPTRAENPTGLGLAIVRELAGAMGGAVGAENRPEGGARIVLAFPTLPATEPEMGMATDSGDEPAASDAGAGSAVDRAPSTSSGAQPNPAEPLSPATGPRPEPTGPPPDRPPA